MEELLENVVRKLIFKKYPYLYDVEVKDLFSDIPNLSSRLGSIYSCRIKSKECLPAKKQMEINDEIKTIFSMLAPPTNRFGENPKVSCFFDCGKGYEFHSEPGYNR